MSAESLKKLLSRRWQALSARQRKYSELAGQVMIFVVGFLVVSAFQARNLLDTDRQAAPELQGQLLQGSAFDLAETEADSTLVYFFAPWCGVCNASSDNITRLRRMRDEENLQIVMVAVAWEQEEEVQAFATRNDINVPIVLGDSKITEDWQIFGFPSYYVLDKQHRVVSKDFGYSTQVGLWWRTWL